MWSSPSPTTTEKNVQSDKQSCPDERNLAISWGKVREEKKGKNGVL